MEDFDATIPPRRTRESDVPDLDATIPPRRIRRERGEFALGDVIAGRYKVIAILGRGAMGVVYRCFDQTASVDVALKGLPPELSGNEWEMEEIKRNFQLVRNLHHPNIASYNTLEFDHYSGSYFLVMEFVSGTALRKYCSEYYPDHTSIINVLAQIASALDYAHSQQILHRDIKPGNILVDNNGVVKILDFGLAAQIQNSMTRISIVAGSGGTAPYMSPEQWQGRQQKAASDQYALGVVAYELFAGFLPFESADPMVMQQAVLNQKPEKLANVSPSIQYAVDRALSKDPAERFANCTAFVEALTAPVKPALSRKTLKLWGKIAAVIMTGLLLMGGGAGIWLALQNTDFSANHSTVEAEEETAGGAKAQAVSPEKISKELSAAKAQGIIFSDDNKTLVECPKDLTGEVVIPSCVTRIQYTAFANCKELTAITIPESVTVIENAAFANCENLTAITIPGSVTDLYNDTFSGCKKLTEVKISKGVEYICSSMFYGCENLVRITIPDSVCEIRKEAFYGCKKLREITIPVDCEVAEDAFPKGCKVWRGSKTASTEKKQPIAKDLAAAKAQGIIFSDDNKTLVKCPADLSGEVVIPSCVTHIWNKAFDGCKKITKVTIPDNVVSIGSAAFNGCTTLVEVNIGDGVTAVGDGAFANCSSLEKVNMGENVVSIGESAFFRCSKLSAVVIPEKVETIGNRAFQECNALTEIIIPDSVKIIGNSAFHYCHKLTKVTIGKNVKSIGDSAFSSTALIHITIPGSVEIIGFQAFSYCKNLAYVQFSHGVKRIQRYAFSDCDALTGVILPDSVEEVVSEAFASCGSLRQISVPANCEVGGGQSGEIIRRKK